MKLKIGLLLALSFLIFSCGNEQVETQKEVQTEKNLQVDYAHLADSLTQRAQGVIKENLMNALADGGTLNALEFCNYKAIHLTDSMSNELDVKLKRVSDKNRNPLNTANEYEMNFILSQKDKMKNGENPETKLQEIDGKMISYQPIVTNAMCLQCHGTVGETMTQETADKIKSLYPLDLATGYQVNELRGIWVVEMEKKR